MDAKYAALDVTWVCPNCGTANLDAYDLTASPVCSTDDCPDTMTWEIILGPVKQAELNQLLIELEQQGVALDWGA